MKQLFSALALLLLFSPQASFAASGCSYPSSIDSFPDKQAGDFLTVADVNVRTCAIERIQDRLNQVSGGKSPGQTIVGGTGAGEFLNLSSTASGSKGAIFFGVGGQNLFDEATGRLSIGNASPTRPLEVTSTQNAVVLFTTTGGSVGPRLELFHNATAQPDVAAINFLGNDSTGVTRFVGQIFSNYTDATSTNLSSILSFCVMNAVNAGNCATHGFLSALGVWTDGSGEAQKEYEKPISGSVIGKLKELKTLGIYHGKGTPANKVPTAERHYSPTAEEFYTVFGLGNDPAKGNPGIAPKDVGWLAVSAVLELEKRVSILEAKTK